MRGSDEVNACQKNGNEFTENPTGVVFVFFRPAYMLDVECVPVSSFEFPPNHYYVSTFLNGKSQCEAADECNACGTRSSGQLKI